MIKKYAKGLVVLLGAMAAVGDASAAISSDRTSAGDGNRHTGCTLLIDIREAPPGSSQYFVTGSIIIPGQYPAPGGVYDPPGYTASLTLDQALKVAGSEWYHSLPCTGQDGGYPSCDLVRYGPSSDEQNVYSGSGIVRCNKDGSAN